MQNSSGTSHPHPPIGGRFIVHPSRPLPGAGGGQSAFVATDLRTGRDDLMAVAVSRTEPARANALHDLNDPVENLLGPLASGVAPGSDNAPAFYIICLAPPGPALSTIGKPWPEAALIAQVLRPAAQVLRELEIRQLTHRAIRSNNIFLAGAGQPVTLGCAWAAPPALHQPLAYEPFYSLMCQPVAGRGDGSVADDVYALGCLLIALASGTSPLAGLDTAAVLGRKAEHGSFAALAAEVRLPSMIADLARGMLAEDPDHRPTPAMLLDPATARGRRVAARPPRRAPRPLAVGAAVAWDARTLAQAIAMEPASGVRALRDGRVTHWLRRSLGDAALCTRTDELVRQRATDPQQQEAIADTMLAMRVVAALEPLAPLCWRGAILWPDGLGPALAAANDRDANLLEPLREIVATEAIGAWATQREDHCDVTQLKAKARTNQALLRGRAPAGGIVRLTYALNPLLPCRGAAGTAHWIANLDAVAPAMEAVAQAGQDPFEPEIASFLAARATRDLDIEINTLAAHNGPGPATMPWLRILALLQSRYALHPMTALTRRIVVQAEPLIAAWNNREKRAAVRTQLQTLAEAGLFPPIVAILDNVASLDADAAGAADAAASLAQIDATLNLIAGGTAGRAAMAARYGQEIASGAGLTALAAAILATVLG